MSLIDIVQRVKSEPWAEGENIPWNDPDFSQAMLKEHLTQAHDGASRRATIIDQHVRFIHEDLLRGIPSHIVDLGCGPGLYSERLARLGHICQGIDYSPASIAYARAVAEREGLPCTYLLQDLRRAPYGVGHNLVMLLYGEFNVFTHEDAQIILSKAYQALTPGGMVLLEPSTEPHVRRMGTEPATWYASTSGLFSPRSHIVLSEAAWDEARRVATHRYYVVDAITAAIRRYAASYQAYSDTEYRDLLEHCGFRRVTFFPSLTGESDPVDDLVALAAWKD